MTSSENLASLATYEPWMFQSTAAYADSWLTEALARDTETLTRALQKTLSSDTNNNSDTVITYPDTISPFYKAQQDTPSGSGVSGSDPEMVASAPRRRDTAATKKITKRKPRASKKCQTTFIMADPANFRQMVQQVTGLRLETLQLQQHIVKPEPTRLTGMGLSLPAPDTSSFLLDRSQVSEEGVCGGGEASGQVAYDYSVVDVGGGSGRVYEGYHSFPTLESCQVMCDY